MFELSEVHVIPIPIPIPVFVKFNDSDSYVNELVFEALCKMCICVLIYR